jgi:hypothetical protein
MSNAKSKPAPRNPVAVAMMERYGKTQTTHKHKNDKRSKDAKKSWKREEW